MMTVLTIAIGLLLTLIGLALYGTSGAVTALIPAFAGLPIILCGLAALRPSWHRHAMHAAMVLALLTMLLPLMRLPKTISEGGLNTAALGMIIMMLLGGILLVMGIYSFIDARRRRKVAVAKANAG